uniref:NADH-ubiquinone oxidoreductase chain 2 n=1 Tax=Lanthanotus borneensis TaxID=62058 RepID=Q5EX63_LANBO|nr:NADH dehydrogenase subunit 2 [Lanthanotus borneensis]
MSPTINLILLSSLATGTILTLSSYHWMFAWIGLELNTLAIVPIMSKAHHPRATEAATKYFLVQAAASSMVLFSALINAQSTGLWDITQLSNEAAKIMLTTALSMKLGLVPMHFWLPEVLQAMPILTMLIITTWQKLAPTTLLLLIWDQIPTYPIATIGWLSILIGGLGGLNQTQLRKMMAYSSIAHVGWTVTILTISPSVALFSLALYILMTTPTILIMHISLSKTIKDTTTITTTLPPLTTLFAASLLSLGGLPPLTGFLPKWLILQELALQNLAPLATTMAVLTLFSLFFYLRLMYTSAMTLSPNTTPSKNKWRLKTNLNTTLISILLPTTTLALPMLPLMG